MRRAAPLLAIVFCALSVGSALADDHRDDNDRRAPRGHRQDRGDHRNNDAAIRAQQQTGGGRVLSVQPGDDGRSHRVKVLKDGEVHVLTVPESEQNR
jgi:hypothetical protein